MSDQQYPPPQEPPNPYAAPAPSQEPATAEPGSAYRYGQQLPPPGAYNTAPPGPNVAAIVQLVLSVLLVLPLCGLTLPSIVLAIVALARNDAAPQSSRRLTLIGWICLAVSVIVGVLLWSWIWNADVSGEIEGV